MKQTPTNYLLQRMHLTAESNRAFLFTVNGIMRLSIQGRAVQYQCVSSLYIMNVCSLSVSEYLIGYCSLVGWSGAKQNIV